MANPTTNFGWQMPTSTDLVTDLPADFEVFGQAVDTALAELKGGTTGQVLSKTSNTNMDFTWVTTDDANAIQNSIVDAKGDLVAASANDTPARLAVGNNGETLVADSSTSTGLRYQGLMAAGKNAIINGSFDIWQRGTSVAVASTVFGYTADRWLTNQQSAATVSRQATSDTTNLPFIQYCARVQRDAGQTSTTVMQFTQPFENVNSIPFVGKTVTLSFYARKGANFSQASSQLSFSLYSGTGTDQNLLQSYTGASQPLASTATLTSTWQRFTTTGTISASATEIAPYFSYTPVGTAGANDYYEITGVQLELGSVATAFARNGATLQGELAACQRYYYRSTTTNTYGRLTGYTPAAGASGMYLTVQPPVRPRVTISAVDYANIALYDGANVVATISSISLGDPSNDVNTINIVATGLTQFRPYAILANNNAAGYIGFSSEL
jgi:hypothetical protein